jgi:competence protein ComEC
MKRRTKLLIIISGLAAVIFTVVLAGFFYHPAKRLEVDFLDVGQGDAELIKAPGGQNILIDGGPDSGVVEQLSAVMLPWDKRIDLMILTHPHDDHVTGLINILERYEVKSILYTGVNHNSPNYIAWLEKVREKKITLVIIDRPRTIMLGDDCRLEILYPFESFLNKEVENLNNTSIAAKLVYGNTGFLFIGDAEKEEEAELLQAEFADAGHLSAVNVLKIGHHGSDTASSADFLAAVHPVMAVIEAGKDNQFGHPSLRTLMKLKRIGAETLRTDERGTIRITSDGRTIELMK